MLLPQFLEPNLLDSLRRQLDEADFVDRTHEGIGTELCLPPGPLSGILELLVNDQALFEVVEALTGCEAIGCFEGRVYRMVPGEGHYDSWHGDLGHDRLVAMSVNLGAEEYRGGLLQIRRVDAPEIEHEVANVGPGDAILFRIAPGLAHRVTEVEGSVAKTAYAGWFRARPHFHELLKARLSPAAGR